MPLNGLFSFLRYPLGTRKTLALQAHFCKYLSDNSENKAFLLIFWHVNIFVTFKVQYHFVAIK